MKTNALTRMAYHSNPEAVRDREKREYHRNRIRAEVKGLKAPALAYHRQGCQRSLTSQSSEADEGRRRNRSIDGRR